MTRRSGSVLLAFNRSCPLYSVLYPKLHTQGPDQIDVKISFKGVGAELGDIRYRSSELADPLSGPFPPEASCPAAVKGMLSFSFLVIESRLAMIKTFYSTPFRCLFSAA